MPLLTRLAKLRAEAGDSYTPEMPPLEDHAATIAAWFFEVGPTMAAGSGSGAITNSELQAWSELVGIKLLPIEYRILRRLSQEYLSQCFISSRIDCQAPWADYSPDPDIAAQTLKRSIRNIAAL